MSTKPGQLHRLHAWALSPRPTVVFTHPAELVLDQFHAAVESRAAAEPLHVRPMLDRVGPMAVKLAMLAAAGHPDLPTATFGASPTLTVSDREATSATTIAARWLEDAVAFATRIGESGFELSLQRALAAMGEHASVGRRVIARATHLDKKALDLVEATLVDRGDISVARGDQTNPLITWTRLKP